MILQHLTLTLSTRWQNNLGVFREIVVAAGHVVRLGLLVLEHKKRNEYKINE